MKKDIDYSRAYNFVLAHYTIWQAIPATEIVVRETKVSNYKAKTAIVDFRRENGLLKYFNVNEEKIDPKLMANVRNQMMKRIMRGRVK